MEFVPISTNPSKYQDLIRMTASTRRPDQSISRSSDKSRDTRIRSRPSDRSRDRPIGRLSDRSRDKPDESRDRLEMSRDQTERRFSQEVIRNAAESSRIQFIDDDSDLTLRVSVKDKEDGIKELVTGILRNIGETQEDIDSILSPENMRRYWLPAFTHKSFNPEPDMNYEKLEFWGDSALKLSFREYLATKYPNLNESELSNLSNYYMATEEQASMANKYGLDRNLLTYMPITKNIQEDLFESFYGALYSTGGLELVNRLTRFIYDSVNIDSRHALGSPITRVQQTIQSFNLPRLKEWYVQTPNGIKSILYYDDQKDANQFSRRLNIRHSRDNHSIPGRTIYKIIESIGTSRSIAKANVYLALSEIFNRNGIYREQERIKARSMQSIVRLLRDQGEYVTDPKLLTSHLNNEVIVILQGITEDGVKSILRVTIPYIEGRVPREQEIIEIITMLLE